MKEVRIEQNLTFKELSERSGIKVSRIKAIEEGTAKRLFIAEVFLIGASYDMEMKDFFNTELFNQKVTPDNPNEVL